MSRWEIKSTAQVGKDKIEDAEYFTYDKDDSFNNLFTPKEIKTFKDKVEYMWHTISSPFWKTKLWLKNTYWMVQHGIQRMFKGYDDVDIFETFLSFIKRYHKILTELKKNHYSHPFGMTDVEWNNIIDEMIYHLYYMDEDNVNKELLENKPEDWTPCLRTTGEIMNKHKNEFFKLFSKYFYDLWD